MTLKPSSPTSGSTDRYPWARLSGLPSLHTARAAIHVALLLDAGGSEVGDARESYWHHATGGSFAPPDLHLGERLLVDTGLVEEQDQRLIPTAELLAVLDGSFEDAVAVLGSRALVVVRGSLNVRDRPTDQTEAELIDLIPDPTRREEFLLALGRRFDELDTHLVGDVGEMLVVARLREELETLGYPDLARAVRRVSLESDQLGYDISAPRIGGPSRLIEVKSTTTATSDLFVFHISRNEAEAAARFRDWLLIACRVNLDTGDGEILGWCADAAFRDLLPIDSPLGAWEQARVSLATDQLIPGLPSAIL